VSDFAVAGMILAFLVGLAVAAPIWGIDSRDGIESDQSARRVAWLQGAQHGPLLSKAHAGVSGYSVGVAMAGVLRSVARRIDSTADITANLDCQVVPA
jgi:hypothetical protein